MRIVADFCLAALVAGCAASPPSSPLPSLQLATAGPLALSGPALREDRFIAEDDAPLPLERWLPAGKPAAVILALHGFNDYANAFAFHATAWAARGIAT